MAESATAAAEAAAKVAVAAAEAVAVEAPKEEWPPPEPPAAPDVPPTVPSAEAAASAWYGARPPPEAVSIAEPGRQHQVRSAFIHAMEGYTKHAWGIDELDPIKKVGLPSYGMGLTIIDSLDTMVSGARHSHAVTSRGHLTRSPHAVALPVLEPAAHPLRRGRV